MNYIEKIIFNDTEISLKHRHLILTGNNGSGKTYILNQLKNLLADNDVNSFIDTAKDDKEKLISFLEYTIEKFKDPLQLDKNDINSIQNTINNINLTSSIKKISRLLKEKNKFFLEKKEIFFENNQKLTQQEFIIKTFNNPKLEKYFYYYSPEYIENLIKKIDFHIQNILKNKRQIEIFTTNNGPIEFTFFNSSRVPSNEGIQLKVFQSYESLKINSEQIDPPNLLEAYLIYIRKQIDEVLINRTTQQGHNIFRINEIQKWFIKVENDLKDIFENDSIELSFSKDGNEVLINIKDMGRNYTFGQLSSGYKAIFFIYSALLMKAEHKNIKVQEISGVVIIDEIDVHLHISLQKKVLPFLIKAFPKIQFIVSTHSPFVITSTHNDTVVYDLTNNVLIEDNLSNYSNEAIIKGLFHVETNSKELEVRIKAIAKILNSEYPDFEELRSILKFLTPNYQTLNSEAKFYYFKSLNYLLNHNELGDLNV